MGRSLAHFRMVEIQRTLFSILQESHKSWNEAFVHTQFLKSRDFVKQFLLVCLENRRGYLATHIDVVAKFVINEQEVKGPNYWTGDDWANIFDELYMKAVSMEDTMALREALASAHDAEFPKIRKPRANCPALIKACLIVRGNGTLTFDMEPQFRLFTT